MPQKGAHLIGFPRFRHANEQKAQFVFDGTPTSATHLTQMDEQKASWITQNRNYKKLMMCQEEGFMASQRHELEDESIDRLVHIIGERNHARSAKERHSHLCRSTQGNITQLKLNSAVAMRRADLENDIVGNARAAWRARIFRTPPTKRQEKPLESQIVLGQPKPERIMLSDPHEREYTRFLKEGPRRGDGCYTDTPVLSQIRVLRRTFPRDRQQAVVRKLWKRDTE
mmetsp:Transcript_52803/g.67705  ORF Transcript_52803/g.67705 Transcript_52803/m.67705 type:complete len:227 (-) Transcript_52803:111-791(-)